MTPQEIEAMSSILNSPWLWPIIIWSAIWKGVALWKAAKNNSTPWFVVLLIVNTVGILEIIYIFFFSKKKQSAQ